MIAQMGQRQQIWEVSSIMIWQKGYFTDIHVSLVKGTHVYILKLPQCQNLVEISGPTCIHISYASLMFLSTRVCTISVALH